MLFSGRDPENICQKRNLPLLHLGEATGVASRDGVRQEPRRGLPMGDSCARHDDDND